MFEGAVLSAGLGLFVLAVATAELWNGRVFTVRGNVILESRAFHRLGIVLHFAIGVFLLVGAYWQWESAARM